MSRGGIRTQWRFRRTMLHGLHPKINSTFGWTNQGPFLLTFSLPETKFFFPIGASMPPKMKITFELIANKATMMKNKKPHLLARNREGENPTSEVWYLEMGAISTNRSFKSKTNIILIQAEGVPSKGDHHREIARVRGQVHGSIERALDLICQVHPRAKIQAQGDGNVYRHEEDNQ